MKPAQASAPTQTAVTEAEASPAKIRKYGRQLEMKMDKRKHYLVTLTFKVERGPSGEWLGVVHHVDFLTDK